MNSKLKILIGLGLLVAAGGVRLTRAQVQQAWIATYGGSANHEDYARAIALDRAGNVYVTGTARDLITSDDIITIKYNRNGNQLWVARYNGPGNSWDSARGLAVDSDGNVHVAGSSLGLGSDSDIVTIKYDGNGNQVWVNRYDSAGADDYANALALDDSGSVYVTGTATIKYASDGTRLWVVSYTGLAPYCCGIDARIAPDNAGNVYVAGTASDGNGRTDFATIKYDASGNELWAARYNGPANLQDYVTDMAVDMAGSVFVTGTSDGLGTSFDFATLKYSPNGSQLWVARLDGGSHAHDEAYALEVDQAGNVQVSGRLDWRCGTVKYDPMGSRLWVARHQDSTRESSAHAVALDSAGHVYVTGAAGEDILTVKLDYTGREVWAIQYTSGGPASGRAVAVDDDGNVYVAGSARTLTDWPDIVIVKYVQSPVITTRLVSAASLPDGLFGFTLIGEPQKTYEIQSSPDLTTWTTLTNFVSNTGTNQITDSASSAQRFYRAVKGP